MIKSLAIISGYLLIIIKTISGQPQLIDNFNDGDSINNFGYSWRFYTESTYPIVPTFGPGRPPAGGASSSVNQNGFTTSGAADKFAIIPFTFGEEWPAGIGITGYPYICISALLAPEGSYADLSSAFGVHFKCRSHRSDLAFTLWVETDDIIKDESLAYYEKNFSTLSSWREFTFYFTTIPY